MCYTGYAFACLLTFGIGVSTCADAGQLTILHSFDSTDSTDGIAPSAGLVASNGMLYGTTPDGGSFGLGTVFEVDPATGSESVLTSFGGHLSPYYPTASLIAHDGYLYGTSTYGGNSGCGPGCGTVFKVEPTTGRTTVLYAFTGSANGGNPRCALTYHNHSLYGTTFEYGANGGGTIFRIDLTGKTETTLHQFNAKTDGAYSLGQLLYFKGSMYGTTDSGGTNGKGILFALDLDTNSFKVLHEFTGGEDGAQPFAGVVQHGNRLYGTTAAGATHGGTVFKYNLTTGSLDTLLAFSRTGPEGYYPQASLTYANGQLLGSASSGGSGEGTLFQVDHMTGAAILLHGFSGTPDGGEPLTTLMSLNGAYYGTTARGGAYDHGTVFKFLP